ncbi:MAG: IS91 family transposase [Deltaproteobacteria bacterium]|nr:IS91 family transposase [Deltaproteobacteria bacterium]
MRNRFSVADIFHRHGGAYLHGHPELSHAQVKALAAARDCRTAALGGHLQACDKCGHERPVYNSCRDRHCPTCQAMKQERWIAQRMARILDVPAFHVVFTIPSELRRLVLSNQTVMYDLLLAAAADTLQILGRDRLGARLGITAVLHTWSRKMLLHPHVHCIVTAGGLALDRSSWIAGNARYLFPVAVMRKLFQGKFLAGLQTARSMGALHVPDDLVSRRAWTAFKAGLHGRPWVVYAKRPLGGPRHIYRYLGRYTHRVAISSSRLLAVSDDRVRFRTRGDRHVDLAPCEFLRRYLLHVLPPGFRKIRHYGLYAPGGLGAGRLRRARELLAVAEDAAPAPAEPSWAALAERLVATLRQCPHCTAPMRDTATIPPTRWHPEPAILDSS